MNPLLTLSLDQAQYYLRTGRAGFADAIEYCDNWNAAKVSTRCDVTVVRVDGVSMPVLVCLNA
jgi:hypothetical protein